MVLEHEIQPYSDWFRDALPSYGESAFFVVLASVVISYLVLAFRHGPLVAGDRLYRTVVGAATDLIQLVAAARLGTGAAVDSGSDSAARLGVAGGVRSDFGFCRVVFESDDAGAGAAVFDVRDVVRPRTWSC